MRILFIKRRIDRVEIFRIQIILSYPESLGESLIMNHLTCPEEFDRIANIGIIYKTKQIVIGRTRLLLCRQILVKIGYYIALGCKIFCVKRYSRRGNRVNACGFYENNWTEMLLDLFPFINNEIMPKIREASEERKAQLLEAARAAGQDNRKHRGMFK